MSKYLNHGNKLLYFAEKTNDSTYATPVKWNGLVGGEMENESESENIYADDIVYATSSGAKSKKVTLKVLQIPKEAETVICGKKYDANEMCTNTGTKKKVALMWCENVIDTETGKEFRRLHIFYDCFLVGQPKFETETDEDKVSVSEIELEFTSTANEEIVDSNMNAIDYVIVDESEKTKPIFDTLGTEVYIPTFA